MEVIILTDYTTPATTVKTAIEAVYVKKSNVIDNLNSTSTENPLSANQGKILNELIGDVVSILMGTGGN